MVLVLAGVLLPAAAATGVGGGGSPVLFGVKSDTCVCVRRWRKKMRLLHACMVNTTWGDQGKKGVQGYG